MRDQNLIQTPKTGWHSEMNAAAQASQIPAGTPGAVTLRARLNQPTLPGTKVLLSLVAILLLMFAGSVSAALTVTTSNQQGTLPFTPSWTPAPDSLIAGMVPTVANGDFSLEDTNRNVNTLTLGGSLTIDTELGNQGDSIGLTTTRSNYVTCGNGSGGGSLLVYTLPVSANGYNLTNITVYGGWADNGRDALGFTVLYSTKANPGNFIWLANVSYNPSVPNNTPSANRAIINDSLGAAIATNVAAVEFDFTDPHVENGFTGYGAITVEGTQATSVAAPVISITTANQTGTSPFLPSWTPETPNLIAGAVPTTAAGNFTLEGSGGTPVLTDGALGASGDVTTFATCGSGGGTVLIYAVPNSGYGADVTNVVVYSGWGDQGRDGQYYIISYSTVAAPTTYIPISTVYYNPQIAGGIASANRVALSTSTGAPLATGVANIKFDFSGPTFSSSFDNGYQGFSEIIVQGQDSATPPPPPSPYLTQDTLPTYAETVVGDQVIFTAAYSNAPPASVQWQFISSDHTVTNDITGATGSTLTLNSVQLTNSGFYCLKAVNATNGLAAPSYSTAAPLVVGSAPAPVNNVLINYAGQCGWGAASSDTNFVPTWTVDTNNDLILGSVYGAPQTPGQFVAGAGNFGQDQAGGDPTVLSDGSFGYLNYWVNVGSSPTLVTCGINPAGASITYTLDTSSAPNGFDLTNITVYGGWGDGGRDEQKYQVLYSTVAAPTTFSALVTVDYNPNDPNNTQCATRTTLLPASGVLASSVYAIEINWNLQGSPPKNGYEGYSEIVVAGSPSAPKPVLTQDITPLTAEDVVNSSLILSAGFSGATSFQWQKNGTNITGATSPTLILSRLQPSDTATNGGYRLVASNASGSAMTRGCAVIVDPAPAATNNVIKAFAYQTSDQASFSPTWDTSALASSLIYGQSFPYGSYGTGNFNDPDVNPASFDRAGGLPVLTDGNYGMFANDGSHPAFATCGPGNGAGQYVIYTLGPNLDGYDITNIQVAGGWNDGGRDSQWYTVSYSTVANPTTFIPLAVVTNSPTVSDESVIRTTLMPATGVLAGNVYAVEVDFTTLPGVPNGYSGYSEVSVFGSPSASDTLPMTVTTMSENTSTPDWVVETDSLIEHQLPSATGPGSFAGNFNGEPPTEGLPALTDGTFGPFDQGSTNFATCGGAFGAGSSITYTSANGWDLTNIVVYSGWGNYDRDGQFYNIRYSTLSAPNTFVPLVSVTYNPPALSGPAANRVQISPANGAVTLATNVYAVTFDFTPQTGNLDNGYSGYAEIVLEGSNLAPATPPRFQPPQAMGGNLVLTGTGGTPDRAYSLLTTTNVLTPMANWTVGASGVLDASGAFSNAVPVSVTNAAAFFRLRMP